MFGRIGRYFTRYRQVLSEIFLHGYGRETGAGVTINEESAMQLALFHRCLDIKSSTIGALPCVLHKVSMKDGVRTYEEATTHPVYKVLRYKPNDLDSPLEFFAQIVLDLDMWGNWYGITEYGANGKLRAIWRVPPQNVRPYWVDYPGKVAYEYTDVRPNEESNPQDPQKKIKLKLMPGEILHLKNLPATAGRSNYSLCGVGLLEIQKETLGLSVASRNFASEMFSNRAVPAGILQYRGNWDKQRKEEVRKAWDETYGPGNRGRTAVLNADIDYKAIANRGVDMQMYEQRMMVEADIPRITGVPAFYVGVKSDTTYSNTREQTRYFHTVTISQLAARIAQGLEKGLIPPNQRDKYEIRFALDEMMRGDDLTRAKYLEAMVKMGAYNPNDVLAAEGRNPREGGDVYITMPGAAPPGGAPAEPPGAPPAEPAPAPQGEQGNV